MPIRSREAIVTLIIAAVATASLAVAGGLIFGSMRRRDVARLRARDVASLLESGHRLEGKLIRVSDAFREMTPEAHSHSLELLENALHFLGDVLARRSYAADILLVGARVAHASAELQVKMSLLEQAELSLRRALEIHKRLLAVDPLDQSYRGDRASAFDKLGLILEGLDRIDEAEAAYRKSIDVRGPLLMENPRSDQVRWRMAICFDRLGVLLRLAGRWDEAEHFLFRGRKVCEVSPPSTHNDPLIRRELAAILRHLGRVLLDRGRQAEAFESFTRAILIQKALLKEEPGSLEDRELLIDALNDQANATRGRR